MPDDKAAKRDPTVLPQRQPRRDNDGPTKSIPPVDDRPTTTPDAAAASLDAHLSWPVAGGDPDLRPIIAGRRADESFGEDLELPETASSETVEYLAMLTSVMRAATAAASAEADRLDTRMSVVAAEVDRLSEEIDALRKAMRRPVRERVKLRDDEIDAIATAVVARLQESFEVVDDR